MLETCVRRLKPPNACIRLRRSAIAKNAIEDDERG
jgi:hypothetical protein